VFFPLNTGVFFPPKVDFFPSKAVFFSPKTRIFPAKTCILRALKPVFFQQKVVVQNRIKKSLCFFFPAQNDIWLKC
jgi:hypothetical protein